MSNELIQAQIARWIDEAYERGRVNIHTDSQELGERWGDVILVNYYGNLQIQIDREQEVERNETRISNSLVYFASLAVRKEQGGEAN